MHLRSVVFAFGVAGTASCSTPEVPHRAPDVTPNATAALSRYNPLPIPPLLEPSSTMNGVAHYDLVAGPVTKRFGAGLTSPALGYNGDYLGPTLRFRRGAPVEVTLTNATNAKTSLHWHGLRSLSEVDVTGAGLVPGASATVTFVPDQAAATLWYHPHEHMDVGRQVYMGLSGVYLIDDALSDGVAIPKTYGYDDLPLVIQDRRFNADGTLGYKTVKDDDDGMLGNRIIVNGTADPVAHVPAALVRLRLINASNARTYDFALSNGQSFWQVGSDGGLLERPVSLSDIFMYPGERAEIVVDFAATSGAVALISRPFAPPGVPLEEPDGGTPADPRVRPPLGSAFNIVNFIVEPAIPSALHELPASLVAVPAADVGHAVNGAHPRPFNLEDTADLVINGKLMDMSGKRIDEHVRSGTTEVWRVHNFATDLDHPFHVHGGPFRVLARSTGTVQPGELGYKDTLSIKPNETVDLLVDFTGLRGKYYYHCHVLEHEDRGMMGTFAVEP